MKPTKVKIPFGGLMKKRNLVLLGAAFAVFMLFAGCQNNAGDSSGGGNERSDKAALELIKGKLKIPSVVKKASDLQLPKEMGGAVIIWKSDKPDVIGNDGTVNIPEGAGSTDVKLTATISKGGSSVDVPFTVKVFHKNQPIDDASLVQQAKEKLELPKTELITNEKLELPQTVGEGTNAVDVEWSSDNEDVIKNDGTVTRPDGSGITEVKLTATLKKGSKSVKKVFVIKVHNKESQQDDEAVVNIAKNNLILKTSEVKTDGKISLPEVQDGAAVKWASGNKAVISDDGTVTCPSGTGVTIVELTATITKGGKKAVKTFYITVHNKDNADKEIVDAAKEKLSVSPVKITSDTAISLPQTVGEGADVVNVTWSSSNKTVIADNGTVTRPDGAGTTEVKLTATLKKGNITAEKEFTLTVYNKGETITDKQAVVFAKENLSLPEIVLEGSTINLKTSAENGVSITWSSSDAIINAADGKVNNLTDTKPKSVTLTATISKGTESATKKFMIAVRPTDAKLVDAAEASLTYPEKIETDSINLPKAVGEGDYAVTVTWTISDKDVISENGTVTRPLGAGEKPVTLKAELKKGSILKVKTFNLKVIYGKGNYWNAYKDEYKSGDVRIKESGEDVEAVVSVDTTGTWDAGVFKKYVFPTAATYMVSFEIKSSEPAETTFAVRHIGKGNLAKAPVKIGTNWAEQRYLVAVDDESNGENLDISIALKKGTTNIRNVKVFNTWDNWQEWEKTEYGSWGLWKSDKVGKLASSTAYDFAKDSIKVKNYLYTTLTHEGDWAYGFTYSRKYTAGAHYFKFKSTGFNGKIAVVAEGDKNLSRSIVPASIIDGTECWFSFDIPSEYVGKKIAMNFLTADKSGPREETIKIEDVKIFDAKPSSGTELESFKTFITLNDSWSIENLTDNGSIISGTPVASPDSVSLKLANDVQDGQYFKLIYGPKDFEAGMYKITYNKNVPENGMGWKELKIGKTAYTLGGDYVLIPEAGKGKIEFGLKKAGDYSISNMKIEKLDKGLLELGGIVGDVQEPAWEIDNVNWTNMDIPGGIYEYEFTAKNTLHKWQVSAFKGQWKPHFLGASVPADGNEVKLTYDDGNSCVSKNLTPGNKYKITVRVQGFDVYAKITPVTATVSAKWSIENSTSVSDIITYSNATDDSMTFTIKNDISDGALVLRYGKENFEYGKAYRPVYNFSDDSVLAFRYWFTDGNASSEHKDDYSWFDKSCNGYYCFGLKKGGTYTISNMKIEGISISKDSLLKGGIVGLGASWEARNALWHRVDEANKVYEYFFTARATSEEWKVLKFRDWSVKFGNAVVPPDNTEVLLQENPSDDKNRKTENLTVGENYTLTVTVRDGKVYAKIKQR